MCSSDLGRAGPRSRARRRDGRAARCRAGWPRARKPGAPQGDARGERPRPRAVSLNCWPTRSRPRAPVCAGPSLSARRLALTLTAPVVRAARWRPARSGESHPQRGQHRARAAGGGGLQARAQGKVGAHAGRDARARGCVGCVSSRGAASCCASRNALHEVLRAHELLSSHCPPFSREHAHLPHSRLPMACSTVSSSVGYPCVNPSVDSDDLCCMMTTAVSVVTDALRDSA